MTWARHNLHLRLVNDPGRLLGIGHHFCWVKDLIIGTNPEAKRLIQMGEVCSGGSRILRQGHMDGIGVVVSNRKFCTLRPVSYRCSYILFVFSSSFWFLQTVAENGGFLKHICHKKGVLKKSNLLLPYSLCRFIAGLVMAKVLLFSDRI